MCGIAGIAAQNGTLEAATRMVRAMAHRGPDDSGTQLVDRGAREIAFGSVRLAIIDVSTAGHMPMQDPATGNWITFNGEIYNFRTLRGELEAVGCVLHSRTDTEVVLHAYARWGTDCVTRFRGMFAFAIWDHSRRELFLARDRVGEKPLYYVEDKRHQRFLFASELRALLASGLVDRQLDPATLSVYLHNGHTVAPRTMLRSVRSLMPGCWMRTAANGEVLETRRYWRVPVYQRPDTPVTLERVREVLQDSVEMRTISEVPLGAFLSGGQDSSTIVALMSRRSTSLRTFSIGFHEPNYDESYYSQWVANRFCAEHTAITLGKHEFDAWLDAGLSAMDQPTFDGLNTYFVSRAARENGLTVALSGLGGDELFGGYPIFRDAPAIALLSRAGTFTPEWVRRVFVRGLAGSRGIRKALHVVGQQVPEQLHLLAAYQARQALFPQAAQRSLLADNSAADDVWFGLPQEFLQFVSSEGLDADPLSQLSRYSLHLFQTQRTLRDSDAMSMAVSLELRSAFTDHVFIETVWQLPGSIRCAAPPDKPYQRSLVGPILGGDFPPRKKQGFIFPFEEWLRAGKTIERVSETLKDRVMAAAAGLNSDAVAALDLQQSRLPWSRIWSVFVLLNWTAENDVTM